MDIAYQEGIRKSKLKSTSEENMQPQMPEIRCSCGKKILIVPDLAAMSLAIKRHKEEHQDVDEELLVEEILKTLAETK
ncbi:MAG: hypothetical protein NWE93_13230 [Candidatus Bathyarchaeota archaeon]|nr:hypothetical protein [Candidatus Bathyarchaeota archaeon]